MLGCRELELSQRCLVLPETFRKGSVNHLPVLTAISRRREDRAMGMRYKSETIVGVGEDDLSQCRGGNRRSHTQPALTELVGALIRGGSDGKRDPEQTGQYDYG